MLIVMCLLYFEVVIVVVLFFYVNILVVVFCGVMYIGYGMNIVVICLFNIKFIKFEVA